MDGLSVRMGQWESMHEIDLPDPNVSCAKCEAICCRLEVILMGDDSVPAHLSIEDTWGGEVMRRLDDGWCAALDRNTMMCTIYERRPLVCGEYEMGGLACVEERTVYFHRSRLVS